MIQTETISSPLETNSDWQGNCGRSGMNDKSKQTEIGIDEVPEWAREPHLRDILKREYEEAQKRPRDVALEKRDPCLKE